MARLLADLATHLEKRYDGALVAEFLMRCLFTMLAEDVGFTLTDVKGAFTKARAKDVETALEALSALGLVTWSDAPAGRRYRPTGRGA
ncbi:MAG: hypothetical protein EXR72_18330 [Myxococcales bacterium]|nr:hypothetical protein [Myxococcales bacterium]